MEYGSEYIQSGILIEYIIRNTLPFDYIHSEKFMNKIYISVRTLIKLKREIFMFPKQLKAFALR